MSNRDWHRSVAKAPRFLPCFPCVTALRPQVYACRGQSGEGQGWATSPFSLTAHFAATRWRCGFELVEAEKAALTCPIEGKVGNAQQSSSGQRRRLRSFNDGRDNVGREKADTEQLPKVPLAIVRRPRIGFVGEESLSRAGRQSNQFHGTVRANAPTGKERRVGGTDASSTPTTKPVSLLQKPPLR